MSPGGRNGGEDDGVGVLLDDEERRRSKGRSWPVRSPAEKGIWARRVREEASEVDWRRWNWEGLGRDDYAWGLRAVSQMGFFLLFSHT